MVYESIRDCSIITLLQIFPPPIHLIYLCLPLSSTHTHISSPPSLVASDATHIHICFDPQGLNLFLEVQFREVWIFFCLGFH